MPSKNGRTPAWNAARFFAVICTPLGFPVEPEVKRMYAVSSGLSQSSSETGAQGPCKISRSCERVRPGSSSVPVRSAITHGFASAAICATRSGGYVTSTGT